MLFITVGGANLLIFLIRPKILEILAAIFAWNLLLQRHFSKMAGLTPLRYVRLNRADATITYTLSSLSGLLMLIFLVGCCVKHGPKILACVSKCTPGTDTVPTPIPQSDMPLSVPASYKTLTDSPDADGVAQCSVTEHDHDLSGLSLAVHRPRLLQSMPTMRSTRTLSTSIPSRAEEESGWQHNEKLYQSQKHIAIIAKAAAQARIICPCSQ